MKKAVPGRAWYFVDEAGDPSFYGKGNRLIVGNDGCSRVLILGFVEILDPLPIRRELLRLQEYVTTHPYFQKEPHRSRTAVAFHAKNDLPEVRYLVFDLIKTFDVRAEFIVARKIEHILLNMMIRSKTIFMTILCRACLSKRYAGMKTTFSTLPSVDQRLGSNRSLMQSKRVLSVTPVGKTERVLQSGVFKLKHLVGNRV